MIKSKKNIAKLTLPASLFDQLTLLGTPKHYWALVLVFWLCLLG